MDFLASFPEKLYFCSKNMFCGMNGIAIARNLKSMGMSISDISKATGLQEEEIKAL